jgi:hypothetical protein
MKKRLLNSFLIVTFVIVFLISSVSAVWWNPATWNENTITGNVVNDQELEWAETPTFNETNKSLNGFIPAVNNTPSQPLSLCGNISYFASSNLTCCNNSGKLELVSASKCPSYCNGKVYDKNSYTCCKVGNVTNLVYGKNLKCNEYSVCNITYYSYPILYKKSEDTCCKVGNQTNLINGNNAVCGICNGEMYNKNEDTCCKVGNVTDLLSYEKNAVCGECNGKVYDKNSYTCCKIGNVTQTVYGKNEKCSNYALCNIDYDGRGDIYPHLYDKTSDTCCKAGNITQVISGKNAACGTCNGEFYSKNDDKCCKIGNRYTLLDENNDFFVDENTKCSDYATCDGKVYDKTEQTCCSVGGKKSLIDSYGDKVKCASCGGEIYDSVRGTCCKIGSKNVVIEKDQTGSYKNGKYQVKYLPVKCSDYNSVCEDTPYNTATETCCNVKGKIQLIEGKKAKCASCDGVIFDDKAYSCCKFNGEDMILEGSCKDYGLCKDRVYNKKEDTCCKVGKKVGVVEGKGVKCGVCGPYVFDKNDLGYDDETHCSLRCVKNAGASDFSLGNYCIA